MFPTKFSGSDGLSCTCCIIRVEREKLKRGEKRRGKSENDDGGRQCLMRGLIPSPLFGSRLGSALWTCSSQSLQLPCVSVLWASCHPGCHFDVESIEFKDLFQSQKKDLLNWIPHVMVHGLNSCLWFLTPTSC